MHWKKLGFLFVADSLSDELVTHASYPYAIALGDDLFRVFYSARDRNQRSSITYIDVRVHHEQLTVVNVHALPVLRPGESGGFDADGVSMSCIVKADGHFWLYYLAWYLESDGRFKNTLGLAVSSDGERFEKVQNNPIFNISNEDLSFTYPHVVVNDTGWHMWFGSVQSWGEDNLPLQHAIKYVHSHNGIIWDTPAIATAGLEMESGSAIVRPSVRCEAGQYRMWYCYRGEHYRLGFADSLDGIIFHRKDHLVDIDMSVQGWDSESLAYPSVFEHKGHLYLLYNGNGYGRTGFGVAVGDIL